MAKVNWAAIEATIAAVKGNDRVSHTMRDMKALVKEAANHVDGTYKMMNKMLNTASYDTAEFALMLPADILAEALMKAINRYEATIGSREQEALRLMKEALESSKLA